MIKKIIEAGLYLFIFLLPWQTRLIWREATINGDIWEYGRFSLYGTEIFLWLLLVIFGLSFFSKTRVRPISLKSLFDKLRRPAALVYWLAVIFIIISGLSVLWALDFSLAASRWLIILEAGALMALVVNAGWRLEKIAIAWAAAAAGQGIFAWLQFFTQSVPASKWLGLAWHSPLSPGAVILETQSERWLRAYGSFPHANMLGGFLAVGLILLVYLALVADRRWQRLLILVGLVPVAGGLFFTFSRSAFLALGLALLFILLMLMFWKKGESLRRFFTMMLVMTLLLASLAAIYWPLVATRIFGGQRLETHSIDQRISYTWQAADLIGERSLTGFGLGNYTLALYQRLDRHLPGYSYQPVHNIYILVWAETGLVGILSLGLTLLACLIFGLRSIFTAKDAGRSLPQGIALACLIAILTIGLFDHYPFTLYSGIMSFWLILALNISYLSGPKRFLDRP